MSASGLSKPAAVGFQVSGPPVMETGHDASAVTALRRLVALAACSDSRRYCVVPCQIWSTTWQDLMGDPAAFPSPGI
jgi:hypothetical protein